MTGSAGQQRVTPSFVAAYPIHIPPFDVQRRIVEEIEVERQMVEANRKLIEIFEQKIQVKLVEIWGTESHECNHT